MGFALFLLLCFFLFDFVPELVGLRLPGFGVGLAFRAEVHGGLRRLEVCGFRAALFDHGGEELRVLEHRARAQMVRVERLLVLIFLEQRLLQAFEEALVLDVRARIVDEDARLDIAVRIDVAVLARAGDAAADELAVVLEVDGENRFAALYAADFADAVQHVGALLRRRQQVERGFVAHGHVVEVPREPRALVDEHVEEFVGRDGGDILARVADGRAEDNAVLAQEVHGVHDFVEITLAAAAVVDFAEALDADGEAQVADFRDLLAEILVDKGAVREGVELAVRMLTAEA